MLVTKGEGGYAVFNEPTVDDFSRTGNQVGGHKPEAGMNKWRVSF